MGVLKNEFHFSDFCQSVNYIGLHTKFARTPPGSLTLHVTQCSLLFSEPQKHEIHSLTEICCKHYIGSLEVYHISTVTAPGQVAQ